MDANFKPNHSFLSTPNPVNHQQNYRNPQMVNIGSIQINFNHNPNTSYSTAHYQPSTNMSNLSNFSARTFKTN